MKSKTFYNSLSSKAFQFYLVILLLSSCNIRNNENHKFSEKINNVIDSYRKNRKISFVTRNDTTNLQRIIKKLNHKSPNDFKSFFKYIDSIATYHCICNILKENDNFDIYVYISTSKSKNKIYHKFNIFTETEYLKKPQDYAISIRLHNDTIFVKEISNYKFSNPIYEMGLASKKMARQREIPFLIFNSIAKMKWEVKDDLYLIDSIQTISKMEIDGTLIHHFKNFDYDTPSSHIPFIREMYISLEKGILGLKYYAGNYTYKCWLK